MNPADGYTYTAIELDAIAHLSVEKDDTVDLRVKRIKFFEFIGDRESRDLLLRATVADVIDNPVEGLLDYDLPFIAEPDDRYVGTNNEGDVQC